MRRYWIVACLFLCVAGPALADGELDSKIAIADKTRLADYSKVRTEAIAEAKAGGSAADNAILEKILAGESLSFRGDFDPTGKWKCRTIKLGGTLPLTIYDWFDCRISDDGSGWYLKKTTGSQRTSGRFYDDDDARLVYLGALHYGGEEPVAYGKDPQRDQVAFVFRPEADRLRMEFPSPRFESKLDIIELKR
jgi:hypothetical protein